MSPFLIVLALAIVATARAVRLVAIDKLTEPARARLIRCRGVDSMIVYGLHCPMCLAVWAAAPAACAVWWTTGQAALGITSWVGVPILWGAIAYAAGWLVVREGA